MSARSLAGSLTTPGAGLLQLVSSNAAARNRLGRFSVTRVRLIGLSPARPLFAVCPNDPEPNAFVLRDIIPCLDPEMQNHGFTSRA